jgi:DNA-directed RNA polymerase specialized sigma24 family protein
MSCRKPQEATLFDDPNEAYKRAGKNDPATVDRKALVEGVVGWCNRLAGKFLAEQRTKGRPLDIDLDDLRSEAYVAACEAAEFYHPSSGFQFTTFVRPWVWARFLAVADQRRTFRAAAMEFPERVPDREATDGEAEVDEPSEDQRRLMAKLPPFSRELVRLHVFERVSIGALATRFDLDLKDIRLALRTAAELIGQTKTKGAEADAGIDRMLAAAGS